ncbi:phage tail terminator-like protein [Acinetobacter gerneri]|uniref:phage tail terminator-like protein n=1 Tax=Acinetobacter gerneri TaxID=202952 RepID=UPI0028A962A2|nr:phage tail terminator-like protein [Acinetobacter gerneri]
MTNEQVRQAITARLAAFTGIEQEKIQYSNMNGFSIPKAGLWCRVTIRNGGTFISGLADKPCTRTTGAITIQIFARKNTGVKSLSELADKWVQHLQFYRVEDLECLEANVIDVGEDDDFYQYNVTTNYRIN